jgi:hypothetical protein
MEHAHKHEHGHQRPPWHRNLHRNWRTWFVVGLMLAAMLMYVLSDNERFGPGRGSGRMPPPVPATP